MEFSTIYIISRDFMAHQEPGTPYDVLTSTRETIVACNEDGDLDDLVEFIDTPENLFQLLAAAASVHQAREA